MSVTVGPDHAVKFDELAKDVIGDDADSDGEYQFDSEANSKNKESNDDGKSQVPSYMLFDFRKGNNDWPLNAWLVDPKQAEKLIEKSVEEAQEAVKMKRKNDNDADEDVNKGHKDVRFGEFNPADAAKVNVIKEVELPRIQNESDFEELKDGSYALIIKPGHRLKLKLSELLSGGDTAKEQRLKNEERMRKNAAMYSNNAYMSDVQVAGMESNQVAPMMEGPPMMNAGGGGFGNRFLFKEYINEYSITMDIKLLAPPPDKGISLFQTALVHTKEAKRTGATELSKSDGECIINQACGVGILGTYGDVTTAKLEPGIWKRVVVSVKCANKKGEKGEYKTWVNTKPGASIKEDIIVKNERFALRPDEFYIFSSDKMEMIPGNIAIRTIRIDMAAATDATVKSNRARDKILSTYEEQRKQEVEDQRKYFSLHALFKKPRPMWMAPSFVASFGDAYFENTLFEGSSNLAWSYSSINFAFQAIIERESDLYCWSREQISRQDKAPLILFLLRGDKNHEARVTLSNVLNITQRSSSVFRLMMKLLKAPSEQMLLNCLRKLKREVQDLGIGETLLLPLYVEGKELMMILEHTSERMFRVVVVQTDPYSGLRFHPVNVHPPDIVYRTCMVFSDVKKKNITDDVFWTAVYNMSINSHKGDTAKFYDIILPFLTGKPLEISLVEAEQSELNTPDENSDHLEISNEMKSSETEKRFQGECGEWRLPQKSQTAYVMTFYEAINYLLRRGGLTSLQSDQVKLALLTEFICMMRHDLKFMTPDENGVRVCDLAVKEISRFAVQVVDEMKRIQTDNVASDNNIDRSGDGAIVLTETLILAQNSIAALSFCRHDDLELPPALDLSGPTNETDPDDPELMQYKDSFVWDVARSDPDPGQAVQLLKYVPVDLLQIPKKASTRTEAIRAIRMCERLCNLIDNQEHCIKNNQFLVAAVIEHVFTQVIPVPKARGVGLTANDLYRADRGERRAEKKLKENKNKEEEKLKLKKAAKELKKTRGFSTFTKNSEVKDGFDAQAPEKMDKEFDMNEESDGDDENPIASNEYKTSSSNNLNASVDEKVGDDDDDEEDDQVVSSNHESKDNNSKKKSDKASKKQKLEFFGEEVLPDFEVGKKLEQSITELPCMWDEPIHYDLQVELLLSLQRVADHFAGATMSIQQSRPFDAVCIIVSGCIAAIADALMRKIAVDEPSEVCSQLMGRTVSGRQLGNPGFGISVGTFASQSETLEIYTAELCIARTAVLDYFQSPQQRRLEKIFSWEEEFVVKPSKNLVHFLRMICREVAQPISNPHLLLVDANPVNSTLMNAYPELKCYRDIVFWWKFFLNPDQKAFPNYVAKPEEPSELTNIFRMSAKLDFQWDDRSGGYKVEAMGKNLHCRPDPNQKNPVTGKVIPPEHLPTHRYASTATPSFYLPAPLIKSEDDVIYRPNLPSFEDNQGPVLNQRDSELLVSYLTVPYMRIPLLLSFFASDDRIHKLQSRELRLILDSVMFEPGKHLRMDMSDVEPMMVPTPHTDLLATAYGLLMNELCSSPDTVIRSVLTLMKGGLSCDTGSVVDEDSKTFNTSTTIILYTARLGSRVDNYLSFLVDYALGVHDCIDWPLRETAITGEVLEVLKKGRKDVRDLLNDQFNPLFEDYLKRLDAQTSNDPTNEKLIDRNSRLACDLHSHKLLMYRNYLESDMNPTIAKTIAGGFVYLTTRHTWNKTSAEGARLNMPETELYELLQVQRRRVVNWLNTCRQGVLDEIMQTSLQVSSSLTGSFITSASVLDNQNRWSRIIGNRSVGRWAVGSTRTASQADQLQRQASGSNLLMSPRKPAPLVRRQSYNETVGEVADNGLLGVEIDIQIGQMTLRSKHLEALESNIANNPDVHMIFGDATIQASMLEKAENRTVYRLVGLNHEIEYWNTSHKVCPPLGDEWEREYDPADLGEHEGWIPGLFEPIRKNFFDGPQPPPMQFMMTSKPTPEGAELAIILGLHQTLGGPFKLVYFFRRLRCVHIYECVSHGREWFFTLHLTTDYRYSLRYLQPSAADRKTQHPDWWIRAGGAPYPTGVAESLFNDINKKSKYPAYSAVIVRDRQHQFNLSGGKERLVPDRLLYGAIPDTMLENYLFWQDESFVPSGTRVDDWPLMCRGYKKLRGYPKEDSGEYILIVEFNFNGVWTEGYFPSLNVDKRYVIQITGNPGRSVRIIRRPKALVEADFQQRQRIASMLESLQLIVPPTRIKKKINTDDEENDHTRVNEKFVMDQEVECNYEEKDDYLPCVVRRVNDDGTYNLEYVGEFKWIGVQKNVGVHLIQKRGGDKDLKKKKEKGEGIWHWEGMSDSENDMWREDSENEDEEETEDDKLAKNRVTSFQFDQLRRLLEVAEGNENLLMITLNALSSETNEPYTDVNVLADVVAHYLEKNKDKKSSYQRQNSGFLNQLQSPTDKGNDKMIVPVDSKDYLWLNMLYAPRRTRLHSLAKVLGRIESVSHICAWTKASNPEVKLFDTGYGLHYGCPPIDLVELPRLKLNFTARKDHEGVLRMFSVDHVDLYIPNEMNAGSTKMLSGIPHSLILSNVRGETQILVPVISPIRPIIENETFSTFIVLDRKSIPVSERFFLYPVHVSLSFLLTKGLNSALYLMLLRFLHRDYAEVFRLADSIATDNEFNEEGSKFYTAFAGANDDWHPDAHACRLKISLVTIDSGMIAPWDLTIHIARYIVKIQSVSSCCRLAPEEELQLLDSSFVATSVNSIAFNPNSHDEYSLALNFNRQQLLRAQLTQDQLDVKSKIFDVEIQVPARLLTTNWPFYQDNTVFGENYLQMKEVLSVEEGLNSWNNLKVGGAGDYEKPPGGWLVVAVFHTLWSTSCIKLLQSITELVPIYQSMADFISVKADGQGVMQISRALKIVEFPTVLIMRDGVILDRFDSKIKLIEKLSKSLTVNLTADDKMAHMKRRYKIRLEEAQLAGEDTPLEESVEISKYSQLDWTFDSELCGFNSRVINEGLTAVVEEEELEKEFSPVWEMKQPSSREWTPFKPEINALLEGAYRKGELYDTEVEMTADVQYSEVFEAKDYKIFCSNRMAVSGFFVEGFLCQNRDDDFDVRRRGNRLPVPNEQMFLSEQQKASDLIFVEIERKRKARREKMRMERIGQDIVAIRGSVGFLSNTGIHRWVFRWLHEPERYGTCDAVGICSDAKEDFGTASRSPLLGGSVDKGVSIGLYADGSLYSNGSKIFRVEGVRQFNQPSVTEGTIATDKLNVDEDLKKTIAKVNAPIASLFGKGSLVQCELDTGLQGGTLTFFVDDKPLQGFELTNLYKKLEATELFPCICMCPISKTDMISMDTDKSKGARPPVDADEPKKKDEQLASVSLLNDIELQEMDLRLAGGEEAVKKRKEAEAAALKAKKLAEEEASKKEKAEKQKLQEEEERLAKSVKYQVGDEVEGNYKNKGRWFPGTIEAVKGDGVYDLRYSNSGPSDKNVKAVSIRYKDEKKRPLNKISNLQQKEAPVEKVRWMYESSEGWLVYSKDASRELEESYRTGITSYVITIGSTVHKCNLDTCKQTRGDADGVFKMRRMVLGEGLQGMWEVLTMKFENPTHMTGVMAIKVLEKVWSSGESFSGRKCAMGFLFLYSLLCGDKRFRILGGGMGGEMGMGGVGPNMMVNFPQMGGGNVMMGGGRNDGVRFALLLSQLYSDRHTKSLPASIVNVLGRNPQVSLRMPKFKDTRKSAKSAVFNGWVDEAEPRSPLAELFAKLVPMMAVMKRKGAFHFPPFPPYPELVPPVTTVTIQSSTMEQDESINLKPTNQNETTHPMYRVFDDRYERPELTDYACENRNLSVVSMDMLTNLISTIHYRLGSDEFKPTPPIHMEDTAQFDKLIRSNPEKLVIIDFHASWCGPCKTIEPAFKYMSMTIPVAQFVKVDVDACDDLAKRFKVDSMPRILFIRGGSLLSNVVESISGAGPNFVTDFQEKVIKSAYPDELIKLQLYQSDRPSGAQFDEILNNMAANADVIDTLARKPLKSCNPSIVSMTRSELGLPLIGKDLAFNVSSLDAAKSKPAKMILNRFKEDVVAYANQVNTNQIVKVLNLSDKEVVEYFNMNPDCEKVLQQALVNTKELLQKLYAIKRADTRMMQDTIPMLEQAVNYVAMEIDIKKLIMGNTNEIFSTMREKIKFLLMRIAGQKSTVWIEFLFGVLVSTKGKEDLLKLNPYLNVDMIDNIMNIVSITMLRANRLGHTNRCIGSVISLEELLEKVLKMDATERKVHGSSMTPKLIQLGEEIAKGVTMSRYYMTPIHDPDDSQGTRKLISHYEFDPRYLVFEFIWNIQLRRKQVEIVNDFRNCLSKGKSKVKQMIMGAGKTSVVAPLLALIVADGSLVLSVVPKALVEMSRTRMRETFAAILVKRIYTLEFDRSTVVKPALRRGLENAAKNRGVVVATPTALKSIMLSYVEVLQHIREAVTEGVRSKLEEYKLQANELAEILALFREGVMLLDEVDLILHPLKSELNFPIGDKFDLDGSDEGERWSLPIHLFDAFFFITTNKVTTFEQQGSALEILQNIAVVIQKGIQQRYLQQLPHIILLNVDYYHERIKPLMAEWTYLWLQKQHLYGIDKNEAIRYMLEGAAARSDTVTKISILDQAIHDLKVKLGQELPGPSPTSGYLKNMTEEVIEEHKQSHEIVRRKTEVLMRDESEKMMQMQTELDELEKVRSVAWIHRTLVNDIYELNEKLEKVQIEKDRKIQRIEGEIISLHKKIADLECPRDDSLDNSIIVWCSEAFAASGSGNEASAGLNPGEFSVPAICNQIEDTGLSVRKCGDSEEALSRAKELQRDGLLRCVIIGGDEGGSACGPSCVKSHSGLNCLRCGEPAKKHNGHECGIGGRGSFPLRSAASSANGKFDTVKIITSLTDADTPFSRKYGPLPPERTVFFAAMTVVKEETRLELWRMGSNVIDDSKNLLEWIRKIPPWTNTNNIPQGGISESKMGESKLMGDDGDDDKEGDENEEQVLLQKQICDNTEKLLLEQLKRELEALEVEKLNVTDEMDLQNKQLYESALSCNAALNESVNAQITILNDLESQFDHLMELCQADVCEYPDAKKLQVGPQCCRDAALASAWLQINRNRILSALKNIPPSDKLLLSKHFLTISNQLLFLRRMALAAKVVAHVTSPIHKKLLNLSYNWLSTFLPHCLAKINRVSFGLLSEEDCKQALQADPNVPRSRLKLSVPFIGKDVPSKSSEFAHPDVIIGLSILGYRYSGLRHSDFNDLVDSLTSQFSREIGPARNRESSLLHEKWVYAAGGLIRGIKTTYEGLPWENTAADGSNIPTDKEVVQLKFLQKSNKEQMDKLFDLLHKEPLVIHYYLQKSIFPLHMRSQKMKISASGQAVGGDMLVGRRVGFSGTPSDLLPQELGRCDYETGDDGMMLTICLDRSVTSHEFIQANWTVDLLLKQIAMPEKDNIRYHALIDTGALITGYSNQEVAKILLDKGLTWCDGVVFLDDEDRQQVLVRATGRVVSADQCGVSLEKRFAFYDQIHTTGMDIKHVVNAIAVITLGKDMVFRDYVQGAYRMRGIGIGQRIHVYIIPEVQELMQRELHGAVIPDVVDPEGKSLGHVLEDVVAWLFMNSLRSEQTQWTMLCLQNIGNLYRKNAFRCVLNSTDYFTDTSVDRKLIADEDRVMEVIDEEEDNDDEVLRSKKKESVLDAKKPTEVNYSVGESKDGSNQGVTAKEQPASEASKKEYFESKLNYKATHKWLESDEPPVTVIPSLIAPNKTDYIPNRNVSTHHTPSSTKSSANREDSVVMYRQPTDEFVVKLDKEAALKVFDESIDFALDSGVPDAVTFSDKLRTLLEMHEEFLRPEQHAIGYAIMADVDHFSSADSVSNRLDTEQEREQEQEQEKEVEARRDQQIEVEKFVDREYSRQEEFQRPWPFKILSNPYQTNHGSDYNADDPFYNLKDFKLRFHKPLAFPESLLVSSNYFNPKWLGLHRIKNVVMILELAPSTASDVFKIKSGQVQTAMNIVQKLALQKAHRLLGFEAHQNGYTNFLSREDLRRAVKAATDTDPTDTLLNEIIEKFSMVEPYLSFPEFTALLTSGLLYPEYQGRHWVAVSLAEAETIRRILHLRQRKSPDRLIANASTEICLRYSPMHGPGSPPGGDGGVIFDCSGGWKKNRTTGATVYESAVAHSCFRFFDCDMHFTNASLNVLIKVLNDSPRDRERFFQSANGARRRMEGKWQETPVAKVFTVPDQWIALKQRAQAIFFLEALKLRNITLWEAFTAIDSDNNGYLSPSEFYGALVWLEVPNLTPDDVIDFFEPADKNKDSLIDYKEFVDMFTDIDDKLDQLTGEGGDGSSEGGVGTNQSDVEKRSRRDQLGAAIAKVEKFGAAELREIMVQRKQREQQLQREERIQRQQYNDALDVKLFEEELLASRLRKGGPNPVVAFIEYDEQKKIISMNDFKDLHVDASNGKYIRMVDYKFFTNKLPLRCVMSGKSVFIPIHYKTLADKKWKLPQCNKKHYLKPHSNYYSRCSLCQGRDVSQRCTPCDFNVCKSCIEADKRSFEMERSDPKKHSTFLRCVNASSFTLQIPIAGGADPTTGCFTFTLDVRFEKLPLLGKLQSLLRFTLPDLAKARNLHRSSVYLNGEGIVVGRALERGGGVGSSLDKSMHSGKVGGSSHDPDHEIDDGESGKGGKGGHDSRKAAALLAQSDNPRIKVNVWTILSIKVEPDQSRLSTYVDGRLCHQSIDLDPADLRLNYKVVVLGGGKQANVRGGDVRRVVIHSKALSEEEIRNLAMSLMNDNPVYSIQATRVQALFRGYRLRLTKKFVPKMKEDEKGGSKKMMKKKSGSSSRYNDDEDDDEEDRRRYSDESDCYSDESDCFVA